MFLLNVVYYFIVPVLTMLLIVLIYLATHKYTPETHPVIAIDLDSTIWTEDYPLIGDVYSDAIETMNAMVAEGYEVIIWTSRGGDNAIQCMEHLYSLGLNTKIKHNVHSKYFSSTYPIQSPKIAASVYIDDKSFFGPKDFSNKWWYIQERFL